MKDLMGMGRNELVARIENLETRLTASFEAQVTISENATKRIEEVIRQRYLVIGRLDECASSVHSEYCGGPVSWKDCVEPFCVKNQKALKECV